MRTQTGWQALVYQWVRDTQLLLFITATLFVFRLLLLTIFNEQIAETSTTGDIAQALWMGLRFDIATAVIWVLLPFLVSLLVLKFPLVRMVERIRNSVAMTFAAFGVLLLAMDIFYFRTYGDHYNQMIFGFIHDDTRAILITIWKEYHPLVSFSLIGVFIYFYYKAMKRWLTLDIQHIAHRLGTGLRHWHKAVISISALALMLWGARGGAVMGPPLSVKHAFVTSDVFLNRIALNPLTSLRHTIRDEIQVSRGSLKNWWPSGNIYDVAKVLSSDKVDQQQPLDLDTLLMHEAQGHKGKKPRHVFIMLMESYSGWTVLPMYRDAGFADGVSWVAEHGYYFPNFLPITRSTIESLNALVSGMPFAGFNVNDEATSFKTFPSAIASIYKKMGYKTRFFYGGFLGWQRLDRYLPAQGFDELYGGGDMKAGKDTNEWGVNDEYLFDFVRDTVTDDVPSFNFILSTTNHLPYDLDLDALGYDKKQLPEGLRSSQDNIMKIMGHHWYSDKVLGEFVKEITNKLPQVLVGITGDHQARVQLSFPGENVYERHLVPFVLYGPDVLPDAPKMFDTGGGHLDILPTMIELSAPKGFQYAAFGDNLLAKPEEQWAFGGRYFINNQAMVPINKYDKFFPIPGHTLQQMPPIDSYAEQVKAKKALAWYRGKKGQYAELENSEQ